MSDQDSQLKKAAEALRKENEAKEREIEKQNREIAALLRNIRNIQKWEEDKIDLKKFKLFY